MHIHIRIAYLDKALRAHIILVDLYNRLHNNLYGVSHIKINIGFEAAHITRVKILSTDVE